MKRPKKNNRTEYRIRSELMHKLKPTIWIGRQGLTETIINEIKSQIKIRKIIKVKWLSSVDLNPEEVVFASKTLLLQVRGRTMVLGDLSQDRSSGPRNL